MEKSQLAEGNGTGDICSMSIYARVKSTCRRQPDGRVTPWPQWCKGENVRSCEVQAVKQEGEEGLRKGENEHGCIVRRIRERADASARPLNQQNVNLFLVAEQPVNTVTRNFCRRN